MGKRESDGLAPGGIKSLGFRAQPLAGISPAMEELNWLVSSTSQVYRNSSVTTGPPSMSKPNE